MQLPGYAVQYSSSILIEKGTYYNFEELQLSTVRLLQSLDQLPLLYHRPFHDGEIMERLSVNFLFHVLRQGREVTRGQRVGCVRVSGEVIQAIGA